MAFPISRLTLSSEEVLEALRSSLGYDVSSLSPLAGGQTARAFSFVWDAKKYVVRFSVSPDGLKKDRYAHEQFDCAFRPIPKTIALAHLDQNITYSVTEIADGEKLSNFRGDLFTDRLKSTMVDLVLFNRMTVLPPGNFGRWFEEGNAYYPTWRSYLNSLNDHISANLSEFQKVFSSQELEDILLKYNELIEFCPEIRQLIHGDFSRDNIFSDGENVTAIVDWDNSMYGDALYDIAWASFWEYRIDFESIYRSKIELMGLSEKNISARILCYKIHCAVSSLYWYVSSGQTDHELCEYARIRLLEFASHGKERPSGHFYEDLDRPHYRYDPHRVQGLGEQLYRGPEVDLARPYIVCVGAAQTFGRFCHRPFPALLAEGLEHQVLNLGVGGAGPRLFDRPEILEILNKAQLVVIQVLSARSEGNSFFDNSWTGSLLGTRLADGQEMRFESFLSDLMQTDSLATVQQAVQETRDNYVRHMAELLDRIRVPKILLWLSTGSPDRADDYSAPFALLGPFPQLVNRGMVDALAPHCEAYVECVTQEGIPQKLWPGDQPIDGTQVEKGMLVNRYYPSPEMHAEAAKQLMPECSALLGKQRPPSPSPSFLAAADLGYSPLLIVCAERTGSNLLLGLLNSRKEVFVGGELFNPVLIEKDVISWSPSPKDQLEELSALRRSDPIALLDRLFAMAASNGHQVIGFKLMYGHGDQQTSVRDYLAANRAVRVIHLKRRNLLRRYLSEQRASVTGEWATAKDASPTELPRLDLDFHACIENFSYIERKQAEYDALFSEHRLLKVFYEDLAADPQAVGLSVLSFLELDGASSLAVRYAKTGTDPLRDAIANYDGLSDQFLRWAGFFTD